MVQATDGNGKRVTRTYFANGALRTEVSTAGSYDPLAYGYDAVGARTRFIHRNETGRTDSVRYTYDSHGDLDQLTVRWDAISSAFQSARTFSLGWDARAAALRSPIRVSSAACR